jgi:hypothetical protein
MTTTHVISAAAPVTMRGNPRMTTTAPIHATTRAGRIATHLIGRSIRAKYSHAASRFPGNRSEKSSTIATASTRCGDRNLDRWQPSVHFGWSPVVISGITTAAQLIRARATSGTCANKGSSRRVAFRARATKYVGPPMHDRLIGALETCCRRGEMLRIQNRHVDWEHHQIAIPGRHAKDSENRRVPFDPQGRLAPILKRRALLGPSAFVFGSPAGEYIEDFKTAWESLLLLANGHDITRAKPGAASIARSCGRSTFTGTTSVTKGPAGSWATEWTSARFS